MLHRLVTDFGLKPLCLHVDAGWNTHAAITNIYNLVGEWIFDKYDKNLFPIVIMQQYIQDHQIYN